MKKSATRILKIFSFLLLVFLADRLAGKILENLYQNSTDITISKIRYTFYATNEDILIFGSSRAQNHYIPDTISKGTGYTSFNGGLGGQPLAFSLVQISKTLKRYKPKVIVLDVTPNFTYDKDSDPRLNILAPFYHSDTLVRRILYNNFSKFERLKFLSSVYPYNSMIADLILALVYTPNVSVNGFIACPPGIANENWIPDENYENNGEIPAMQMGYIQEITNLCIQNKIDLWIILSPLYKTTDEELKISRDLKLFAEQQDVHFVDFSKNIYFSDYKLFKDHLHLTSNGAEIFSEMVRDSIFCAEKNY